MKTTLATMQLGMHALQLFALVVILIVMGCGSKSSKTYELDARSFTRKNLDMIQQRAGVLLPDGTQGLNMLYDGDRIDPVLVAKVEIPSSSRDTVAEAIRQLPNSNVHVHKPISEKVAWWNTRNGVVAIERTFDTETSLVHILLNEENGRWLLYVEWYSR